MDYQKCTVEELADFVEVSPCSRITQQMIYYRVRGNTNMVDKIVNARKLVKKRKMIKMLETM